MMFEDGTFTLGLNYWASHAATEMWSDWDPEAVDRDLAVISAHGSTLLRVFPLWPDFQPLNMTKYCGANGGRPREMRLGEDLPPDTPAGKAGMSEIMLQRFEEFCDLAQKHGLKLIVSLMTAHMTGRLYVPRAMENRDLFSDPFALKWEARFYDCFVRRMKSHPAIFAWETGNESNGVSPVSSPEAAWVWTSCMHNIIRLADGTRPIIGVPAHALQPKDGNWLVADQAELSDFINVHKYDLHTPPVMEGFNHIRSLFRCTAECRVNEDVGGKPCFIEETGLWRSTTVSLNRLGDAVRNIMWNLWADNCRGLLWWCAFDQEKFTSAPYNWGDWAGLEHGVFTEKREAHPAAVSMKKFRNFIDSLPFRSLPPVKEDALCLVSSQNTAYVSFILARQAGINLKFQNASDPLQESGCYFLPSVELRGKLSTVDWEALLERVRNGAVLCLSLDDCNLSRLKEVCGFEIEERRVSNEPIQCHFSGADFTVPGNVRKVLSLNGAEVLARDSGGTPVFLRNRYGKGTVFILTFPLEKTAFETPGIFEQDCWKLYREVLPKKHLIRRKNPALIATEHEFSSNESGIVLVNCSTAFVRESLEIADGWRVASAYSDLEECVYADGELSLPPNSGILLLMKRE